jgi:hypothetical protein
VKTATSVRGAVPLSTPPVSSGQHVRPFRRRLCWSAAIPIALLTACSSGPHELAQERTSFEPPSSTPAVASTAVPGAMTRLEELEQISNGCARAVTRSHLPAGTACSPLELQTSENQSPDTHLAGKRAAEICSQLTPPTPQPLTSPDVVRISSTAPTTLECGWSLQQTAGGVSRFGIKVSERPRLVTSSEPSNSSTNSQSSPARRLSDGSTVASTVTKEELDYARVFPDHVLVEVDVLQPQNGESDAWVQASAAIAESVHAAATGRRDWSHAATDSCAPSPRLRWAGRLAVMPLSHS